MKNWFMNLEQREQIFVGAGAIVVAILILWGGIWMPLDKKHRDAQTSVERWQGSLSDPRFVGARLAAAPSGGTGAAASSDSVVVIVDRTLSQLDLNSAVTRRQPTPNGISVSFEAVAFDQLALWLGEMATSHGMEVQSGSLSLATTGGPGRINAQLTLERAP